MLIIINGKSKLCFVFGQIQPCFLEKTNNGSQLESYGAHEVNVVETTIKNA